ncbi:MAG: response regulator transcription factor, partial [Dehalococcoidia bacterium]
LDLRLRRNGGAASLPGGLSARELEVAGLVARGETNRAIAASLSLSEATVESHLRNIFDKLGLDRRAQLAAWVATNNLPTRPRAQAASPGTCDNSLTMVDSLDAGLTSASDSGWCHAEAHRAG